MKLGNLRDLVTSKLGRQVLIGQKHAPTIMFVAGTVGVITAAVLAAKATLKVEEVLEEHTSTMEKINEAAAYNDAVYSSEDVARDRALLYFQSSLKLIKLYGPAVLVGAASIAALTGSHVVLNRRYAAVTAAYAALEKGFAAYRKRVVDQFGEDQDRELRYGVTTREVVEETKEGPVVKTVKSFDPGAPSIYARYFDQLSPSWRRLAEENRVFVACQQDWANEKLKSRGHIFLNEVYDMLGIPRSKAGTVVGWILGEDQPNYVDFGVFDSKSPAAREFVNGINASVLLDFNVSGVIMDKIEK